jgi:hypothetical protein
MAEIDRAFGMHKAQIHRVRTKEMRELETRIGHPTFLSPDQELQMTKHIKTSSRNGCQLSAK